MKFNLLSNWVYDDSLEGLLLFVQRLQELSYSRSDYLEKNIHLSIWELLNEYIEILEFIDATSNGQNELEFISSELIVKISRDQIFSSFLGDKKDCYLEGIKPHNSHKIIKQNLEIISLKISPYKWFNAYKKDILSILKKKKEKDQILHSVNSLFEFLVNYGYQKNTINHLINIYFFDKSKAKMITSITDIEGFLDFFDLQNKEFEVCFAASNFFKEIEDSCNNFNLEIISTREFLYNENLESKFFKNKENKKVFIVCKNIKAVDYAHAYKIASEKISLISDLFALFHHTIRPWYSEYGLVYHHKKQHVINITDPVNPMENLKDQEIEKAKNIFPVFLNNFALVQDSFKRITRGIELHAFSLGTKEVSSQILNLWICFEALLVTETSSSHISMVEDSLKKILLNNILLSKIVNTKDLLIKWNEPAFRNTIAKLPLELQNDLIVATLSIFVLKEYEILANELLSQMTEVPLLRNKIHFIIKNFQSINKIQQYKQDIEKKLSWDIRRIYRTRNKIVHQGMLEDHSYFIVETAHYFLDQILNSIIVKKISYQDIQSIENFLHEVKLIYSENHRFLKSQVNVGVTKDNYIKLIYGIDNNVIL